MYAIILIKRDTAEKHTRPLPQRAAGKSGNGGLPMMRWKELLEKETACLGQMGRDRGLSLHCDCRIFCNQTACGSPAGRAGGKPCVRLAGGRAGDAKRRPQKHAGEQHRRMGDGTGLFLPSHPGRGFGLVSHHDARRRGHGDPRGSGCADDRHRLRRMLYGEPVPEEEFPVQPGIADCIPGTEGSLRSARCRRALYGTSAAGARLSANLATISTASAAACRRTASSMTILFCQSAKWKPRDREEKPWMMSSRKYYDGSGALCVRIPDNR